MDEIKHLEGVERVLNDYISNYVQPLINRIGNIFPKLTDAYDKETDGYVKVGILKAIEIIMACLSGADLEKIEDEK